MIGYTVFPEAARESHPGQVPSRRKGGMFRDHLRGDPFHQTSEAPLRSSRSSTSSRSQTSFDAAIDPARPAPRFTMERYWSEEKPILRSSQIAADLGLPLRRQKDIERIVKNHARSENEVRFRQGVMSQFMQQKLEPILRSKLMNRALSFYRTQAGLQKRRVQQKVWKSEAENQTINLRHTEVKRKYLRVVADEGGNVASMTAQEEPRPKTGPESVSLTGTFPSKPDIELENDERKKRRKQRVITPSEVVTLPNPVEDMKKPDSTFASLGKAQRDDHLKKLVGQMVQDAGDGGCQIEGLAPLVHRYGSKEIANAIRSLGNYHVKEGRIHVHKSRSRYVVRGPNLLQKQMMPATAAGAGVGGGGGASGRQIGGPGGGSTGAPIGVRKVWKNKVVEKKEDGKWHVVSAIAGEEDTKKPREKKEDAGTERQKHVQHLGELQTSHLTEEQAQHLIEQLKTEKDGAANDKPKK